MMFGKFKSFLEGVRVSKMLQEGEADPSNVVHAHLKSGDVVRRAQAAQVNLLYEMDSKGGIKPIAVFLVATLLAPEESKVLAWIAMALYCVISFGYGRLVKAYFRSDDRSAEPKKWAYRYSIASIIAGAAWGFGSITWFSMTNVENQALVSIIMMGIAVSTVLSRTLHLPSMLVFLAMANGPVFVLLILTSSTFSLTAAGLGVVLCIAIAQWAIALNKSQIDSIALRFMVGNLEEVQELTDKARLAAEAGSRAKSEFLSTMSHEVRTPLNAILGMAQILEDSKLESSQRTHVDQIVESGNSLLGILNDILDISAIEAGKMEIEQIDFNAMPEIRYCFELLESNANEKSIETHLQLEDDTAMYARGDEDRTHQVLANLISNAVKFTDTGSITVTVASGSSNLHPGTISSVLPSDCLVFSVADTGIGISEDKRCHLFSPFTQVDQSLSRRFGGTGLGLNICKRLVTLMGGEIDFSSSEGEGSVFWFALPLGNAPVDAVPVSEDVSIQATG